MVCTAAFSRSTSGEIRVNRTLAVGLGLLLTVGIAGCQRTETPAPEGKTAHAGDAPAAAVTDDRLLKAASEPSQWMTYNGTYSEQRHSALTAINRENVKTLGLAWFADYDTNLTQAGTPLAIDGAIYVSTAWSKVYAFDARTGKQLWQYNPKTPGEWIRNVCCGIVNRGIAAYNGKIYIGTLDGRLVALDAKTGKPVWETLTIDKSKSYSITSAPRVAKGKVFIGNSGGEYGVRGYIGAYDAETGKQLWRFYTVPGDPSQPFENDAMKKAAATWGEGTEEWLKWGGGGTVWDAIVYDPQTDLVYFGTGNGTLWNQAYRDKSSADNLYLASVVAVKADTGDYVWHYQATPADTWDYDNASPMMTVDLTIDGKQRHVILQASKNGFMYVIDAATGQVLKADPFTEVNWADGVDLKTGRPRTKKESRFGNTGKPFNLAPGVQGAHGWHSNAFNPDTGLIYIATQDAWFPMVVDTKFKRSDVGYNLGIDFAAQFTYYAAHPTAKRGFSGYLQAWDPVAGKSVWKTEMNQGPTGGALSTASGLIFQGNGAGPPGPPDSPPGTSGGPAELRAFDAKTGEKLWSFPAQTAVLAAPITYEVDGQQYVAVSVGGNVPGGYYAPNYSRLLVFSLNGKATLPPTKEYVPRPLDPPAATATAEVVQAGQDRYAKYCAACHGDNGQTRGSNFPDLTRTPLLHTQEGFDNVVLKGVLAEKGMASFSTELKAEDTQALRAFLVKRANDAKNAPPGFGPPGPGAGPPPPAGGKRPTPQPDATGNQHQAPGT
jgi:quinohemoprotein ethanol dehydrogenase